MNRKSSSASSLALIRAQRDIEVLTEALKRMKVVHERELKRFSSIEEKSHLILKERIAKLTAEVERLSKEVTFRDFTQARASDIALNYGPYSEIQKSLSSEIALHEAWTKRAYEAEAENTRLKALIETSTWVCGKCGYGSEEHGTVGHRAYQCIYEPVLITHNAASRATRTPQADKEEK